MSNAVVEVGVGKHLMFGKALKDAILGTYLRAHEWRNVTRVRHLLQYLEAQHSEFVTALINDIFDNELVKRQVLSGPFAEMRHPQGAGLGSSLGSAIVPKLLGTYELELHDSLEQCFARDGYQAIVNVGAAEGYYAIGAALRTRNTPIFAYDTNEQSAVRILELAKVNAVEGCISARGECKPDDLKTLADEYPRGLLICDCEGFEIELLCPDVISALTHWDIIVETHDSVEQAIATVLRKRLESTHSVLRISPRARSKGDFPITTSRSLVDQVAAMAEGRSARQLWLACYAKKP